jgi:cbb3-type cytochrome oxidase subunit 3
MLLLIRSLLFLTAIALLVAAVIWWIWRQQRRRRRTEDEQTARRRRIDQLDELVTSGERSDRFAPDVAERLRHAVAALREESLAGER